MILSSLVGVFAGAVLWMDRVFIFQVMVSRPMIMGPFIGFMMGDLKAGMLVGLSLELLWLNSPPVGAYLPNDESFCTAVAVPVAVIVGSDASPATAAGLSLVLSLPCSLAGRILDMRLRVMNERIIKNSEDVSEKEISRAMFKAIFRAFLIALLVLGACVCAIGSVAIHIRQFLPGSVLAALSIVPFACVVLGLAALVSREFPRKSHAGMFALGLALVLLLTWMC